MPLAVLGETVLRRGDSDEPLVEGLGEVALREASKSPRTISSDRRCRLCCLREDGPSVAWSERSEPDAELSRRRLRPAVGGIDVGIGIGLGIYAPAEVPVVSDARAGVRVAACGKGNAGSCSEATGVELFLGSFSARTKSPREIFGRKEDFFRELITVGSEEKRQRASYL